MTQIMFSDVVSQSFVPVCFETSGNANAQHSKTLHNSDPDTDHVQQRGWEVCDVP